MSAPLILGTNSIKDTGFSVDNSVRLDGTDDHFSRTLTQAGSSNKAFTFSCWIKRSKRNTDVPRLMHMGGSSASPTHYFRIAFRDDGSGALQQYHEANGGGFQLTTNRLFRDESAWYHIVVAVNSAATELIDRQKIYVNGVQETSMSSSTGMSYNENLGFNDSGDVIYLFRKQQDSDHFPGYACEVAFIDGQQLTPTSFGEFDSDTPSIWKPIDFKDDVTFGTNGFYLEFKDSSALGADTSGNGNNFNYNFGATNQSTDTCTNNFATLNSLTTWTGGSSHVLSEGNTIITIGGTTEKRAVLGTIGFTKGKWYWEVKYVSKTGDNYSTIGITDANTDERNGYGEYDYAYRGEYSSGGLKVNNSTFTSYGDTWTVGDIISVAVDCDNNYIYFAKNGTYQNSGDPTSGSSGTGAAFNIVDASNTDGGQYLPCIGKQDSADPVFNFNFGNPTFSISSGNSDARGHGNFSYAPPSGYFSLCSSNLAEFG